MANFQRTKSYAYVKLGSRQKSMKKYRRATGRHNKTRQKWRSRPPMVQIGYKNKVETRGLINEKKPVTVYNLDELRSLTKENIAIFGKIGNKLRIEMAKEAVAKKIEVYNLNLAKFLKETERQNKKEKKQ
jgi:large subunit ribosomal protein L32e